MKDQVNQAMKWSRKVENRAEGWLKGSPNLPKEIQSWLAKNIWWIVALGAALSALSIITLLNSLFISSVYVNTYFGAWTGSGLWTLRTIVTLVFMVAVVAISLMAIKPLRASSKKGWDYLFLAFLVGATSSVITSFINYSPIDVIFGLIFVGIFATIGVWFLFEIRSYFKKPHTKAHTTVKK